MILFKWRLLIKISNDQKLGKVVTNGSSDITWCTITIMFIAVCKYVVNQCCWCLSGSVGRVICGMKLSEIILSRNWFTLLFCMYLMRFRLKSPGMIKDLFTNLSFSSRVFRKLLLNICFKEGCLWGTLIKRLFLLGISTSINTDSSSFENPFEVYMRGFERYRSKSLQQRIQLEFVQFWNLAGLNYLFVGALWKFYFLEYIYNIKFKVVSSQIIDICWNWRNVQMENRQVFLFIYFQFFEFINYHKHS